MFKTGIQNVLSTINCCCRQHSWVRSFGQFVFSGNFHRGDAARARCLITNVCIADTANCQLTCQENDKHVAASRASKFVIHRQFPRLHGQNSVRAVFGQTMLRTQFRTGKRICRLACRQFSMWKSANVDGLSGAKSEFGQSPSQHRCPHMFVICVC